MILYLISIPIVLLAGKQFYTFTLAAQQKMGEPTLDTIEMFIFILIVLVAFIPFINEVLALLAILATIAHFMSNSEKVNQGLSNLFGLKSNEDKE